MPIAVVMCLWKREQNLPEILDRLERQTNKNFSFWIWNNNIEIQDKVNEMTIQSNVDCHVVHSQQNLYGYARFLMAKISVGNPVIFFDDDQFPHIDFISYMNKCHKQYGKQHICSWWSRAIKPKIGYWRTPMASPNQVVNYCGTGGMVIDRNILDHTDIVETWPDQYKANCQDLWFSYAVYAKLSRKGMCIEKRLDHHPDKHDTYKRNGVAKRKEEVVTQLFKMGLYENFT